MAFWLETVLACASGLLGILTLVWRDWMEAISGVDPDHHNGSVEWIVVFGLLALALGAGALARHAWLGTRSRLKLGAPAPDRER